MFGKSPRNSYPCVNPGLCGVKWHRNGTSARCQKTGSVTHTGNRSTPPRPTLRSHTSDFEEPVFPTVYEELVFQHPAMSGKDYGNLFCPSVLNSEPGKEVLAEIEREYGSDAAQQVLDEAQIRQDRADDPVILNNHGQHPNQWVVQHEETGLRLYLHRESSNQEWIVHAKSYSGGYSLTSKHEDENSDAMRYSGMGVGTRLYREAALIDPDARFKDGTARDSSRGVRRKVHLENPYAFENKRCEWCQEQGIRWRLAGRDDFSSHP